ncbi:hypothetical protein BJ165DRAFT_1534662 [Panaeolus papilionaceus]|nr:hypothetical protein BJ165DRAFT_1534662 [Panaeolus papilionaceus]
MTNNISSEDKPSQRAYRAAMARRDGLPAPVYEDSFQVNIAITEGAGAGALVATDPASAPVRETVASSTGSSLPQHSTTHPLSPGRTPGNPIEIISPSPSRAPYTQLDSPTRQQWPPRLHISTRNGEIFPRPDTRPHNTPNIPPLHRLRPATFIKVTKGPRRHPCEVDEDDNDVIPVRPAKQPCRSLQDEQRTDWREELVLERSLIYQAALRQGLPSHLASIEAFRRTTLNTAREGCEFIEGSSQSPRTIVLSDSSDEDTKDERPTAPKPKDDDDKENKPSELKCSGKRRAKD